MGVYAHAQRQLMFFMPFVCVCDNVPPLSFRKVTLINPHVKTLLKFTHEITSEHTNVNKSIRKLSNNGDNLWSNLIDYHLKIRRFYGQPKTQKSRYSNSC